MIYNQNKKQFFMIIQNELFNDLEQTVEEHNLHLTEDDEDIIRMDKAVFLLDYINYQKSYRLDDVTENGYIRIHSKFLNLYLQKELKKYREFLKKNSYIKIFPYYTEGSQSYGYKVSYIKNPKKLDKGKSEYIVYEFLDKNYEQTLLKSYEKNAQIMHKKEVADRNTKHLTKWINEENIQVDWLSAFKFIENAKSLSIEQKEQYSYSINRIRFHQWYYLRSCNDNRLHSNLTNFPSILRQFLSHKGQELVSLDVKTSQPYLLAGIFNLFIEKKRDKLELLKQGLRGKEVKGKFGSLMNSISLEPLTITDFEAYKNLVCCNDIYSYIGANLSASFISSIKSTSPEGEYKDKVYNPILSRNTTTYYKDLRSYCKVLVLEYMYCSIESSSKRLKEMKQIYPDAVNKFIYDFKFCKELNIPKRQGIRKRTKIQREKIVNSKKLFAKFLQQLEAYIILDVITKELSKIYPEMFMATIHDSIVVPKEYEIEVKAFLQKKLYEILGIEAEIKSENW
jgi:hypothetical protein